jgi:hypothetical protein
MSEGIQVFTGQNRVYSSVNKLCKVQVTPHVLGSPFDTLTALSKVEGWFDRLTILSEVEGPTNPCSGQPPKKRSLCPGA